MEPTDASKAKQRQLLDFTLTQLAPCPAVQAVVALGSVATGYARPGSDIDAAVFMDPLDLYLVPAESVWRPTDTTYHSIMADDPELDRVGIQLDLHRLDLQTWRSPEFDWPEPHRAELADGMIIFDRTGEVGDLIGTRTAMSESQRGTVLDEVLTQAFALLPDGDCTDRWESLGPAEAMDRLQVGYEEFARGLLAYHGKWRPWRSRLLRSLRRLDWLPDAMSGDLESVVAAEGKDFDAYEKRARILRAAFDQLIEQLQLEGRYGPDPDDEAFRRVYDEPGRAWNMDEWNTEHRARHQR